MRRFRQYFLFRIVRYIAWQLIIQTYNTSTTTRHCFILSFFLFVFLLLITFNLVNIVQCSDVLTHFWVSLFTSISVRNKILRDFTVVSRVARPYFIPRQRKKERHEWNKKNYTWPRHTIHEGYQVEETRPDARHVQRRVFLLDEKYGFCLKYHFSMIRSQMQKQRVSTSLLLS